MPSEIEVIAAAALKQALERPPETEVLGEVKAMHIARLAIHALKDCPVCKTHDWQNTGKCNLCSLCMHIKQLENLIE